MFSKNSLRWEKEHRQIGRTTTESYLAALRSLRGVDRSLFDSLEKRRFIRQVLLRGFEDYKYASVIAIEFDIDRVEAVVEEQGSAPAEFTEFVDQHISNLYNLAETLSEEAEVWWLRGSGPRGALSRSLRDSPGAGETHRALADEIVVRRFAHVRTAIAIRRANERFAQDAAALLEGSQREKFVRACEAMLAPGYPLIAELEDRCERVINSRNALKDEIEIAKTLLDQARSFWQRMRSKAAAAHRKAIDIDALTTHRRAQFANLIAEETGQQLPHPNLVDPTAAYREFTKEITLFAKARTKELRAAVGEELWRVIE